VLRAQLARFAAAEFSWISTVRADGRAHSVPVWHVWTEGRAYVVTTPDAVKAGNIAHNPNAVLALPDPVNPLILEGSATLRPAAMALVAPLFKAKYDWDPGNDAGYTAIIEVAPMKLMAWGEHGEGRWNGSEVEAATRL
jgi:hypothetical protein